VKVLQDFAKTHPRLAKVIQSTVEWAGTVGQAWVYVESAATGAALGSAGGPVGSLLGAAGGLMIAYTTQEVVAQGIEKGVEKASQLAYDQGHTPQEKQSFAQSVQNTAQTLLAGLTLRGIRNVGKGGTLPTQTTSYVRELEQRSNLKLHAQQKDALKQDLRQNQYEKISAQELLEHQKEFRKNHNQLIARWEDETKQVWPKYPVMDEATGLQKINKRTGELDFQRYQAHHIVPQQLGGKHEWWNMHPVHPDQHQGGIHGKGSSLNQILKELKKGGF
jgi:predicted ribonuclease toxin of YeeF-YezG toxin-antitoxin module